MQFAKRAEARLSGGRHVPGGFFVCCSTTDRPRIYRPEVIGSYIYLKTLDFGWQLGKVVMVAEDAGSVQYPHTVKKMDLGRQENVHLSLVTLSTSSDEDGTWCWRVHRSSGSVSKPSDTLWNNYCYIDYQDRDLSGSARWSINVKAESELFKQKILLLRGQGSSE